VYSLPPTPPPADDERPSLREALGDILLDLIEAGCLYVRDHPAVKIRISRHVGENVVQIEVEHQRAEGEA